MSDAPRINPPSSPQISELGVIIGRTRGFLLTEQAAQDAVNALAEVVRDVIVHAEGAGVSLICDGDRTSVGATDAKVLEADDLQYLLSEGPCLNAWATNQPFTVADTETDTRWKR